MGTLQYDGVVVEFDDRLLAHLQVVIIQKIRRGESFLMSWRDSPDVGDGHSAIWIHPAQNLYFKFSGGRAAKLNPEWIERLTTSANSSRGLMVMDENAPVAPPANNVQASSVQASTVQASAVRRRAPSGYTKVTTALPENDTAH